MVTVLARREASGRSHPFYPLAVGAVLQVALLAVLAVLVGLGPAGLVVGLVFTVASWILLAQGLRRSGGHRWGLADSITSGRLILTGGVTALVAEAVGGSTHHWALIGLAAVSLVFDAVDGQVARRTGTTSRFGARFDMEADSVLALVLSVYIGATLGWWGVLMGLFRYAFIAATWALPWLSSPLPPRMSRKVVAASQGVVLVVTSAALLPTTVAQICVAASLASLVWSFAVDIRWLWRQESAQRRQRLRAPSRALTGTGVSEPRIPGQRSGTRVAEPATT